MDGWTEIAYSAFGLSLLASALQIGKWVLHANPRVVANAGRLSLMALGGLAVVALLWLLANGRWTQAMMLAAFVMPVFVQGAARWRSLLGPLQAWRCFRPKAKLDRSGGLHSGRAIDPDLVRRSIAVLTAYLEEVQQATEYRLVEARLGNGNGNGRAHMAAAEALAVLGLEPGAGPNQIRAAHRRLQQQFDPESGGTLYLAMKIDEARDVLLASR